MSAPLTREEAINLLAERLYQKFEHIDPTGEVWGDLSEQDRNMYIHGLRFVFESAPKDWLFTAILGCARNDEMGLAAQIGKKSELDDDKSG